MVLAGTGPVGTAATALFGVEGAKVKLSSRMLDSALRTCGFISMKYGVIAEPIEVNDDDSLSSAISDSEVVVACGPSGVRILPQKVWEGVKTLKVLVDANAVPPAGIEGVESDFDGVSVSGRTCFGALGLGDFKMRVHKKLANDIFREKGVTLDLKGVHALAQKLV
jgi:saccharopine dehydrogenase-like NADP-dependent oxidoreductase